jgi:hypothetical protein
LSEKVGDALLLNFDFADHPGTRICAVPVLAKLGAKFELLPLPDTSFIRMILARKAFWTYCFISSRCMASFNWVSAF